MWGQKLHSEVEFVLAHNLVIPSIRQGDTNTKWARRRLIEAK